MSHTPRTAKSAKSRSSEGSAYGASHARPGACVDPHTINNPGQDKGRHAVAHRHNSHRPATTQQNTITAGGDTADGNVKSSADPRVGDAPVITVRITEGPANGIANHGK